MLTFQHLLEIAGLPLGEVRMLRHQDHRKPGYPSPYVLWRDTPQLFEDYQSTQSFGNAAKLRGSVWASFVATLSGETLFVGLYGSEMVGPIPSDRPHPQNRAEVIEAGSGNLYSLTPMTELTDLSGRLTIEWGSGARAWVQRAHKQMKQVVELSRQFAEPEFPGFARFRVRLSELDSCPVSWTAALSSTRGVYVLTCPRTKEQYVGSASGQSGFLGRWREYAVTGHGGNVALKSRAPSDYQVAILQTVGTAATDNEILSLEILWKRKLQSVEMGLNL